MNRHLSRVIIMQTLYEKDFRPGNDIDAIKERNISNYKEEVDREYIDLTIEGILRAQKKLDSKISEAAPEWPLDQISLIDKTILRIAIYEILMNDNVPPKVAINEAVELAKTFGSQNSSKFINGVLGTVYRKSPKYNASEDNRKKQEDSQKHSENASEDNRKKKEDAKE